VFGKVFIPEEVKIEVVDKGKLLKEKEKFIVYRNKYYDKHGILGAPKFPDNLEYALTNRGIK